MEQSNSIWSGNASVNFGVNNSVFQKLKSEEENNDIIDAHFVNLECEDAHAGSTARTIVNISMEAANSPEQIYDELAALLSVFPSLKLE
ncbi:hypothetical protein TNCV_4523981, partial [Trichonephila clavipes]